MTGEEKPIANQSQNTLMGKHLLYLELQYFNPAKDKHTPLPKGLVLEVYCENIKKALSKPVKTEGENPVVIPITRVKEKNYYFKISVDQGYQYINLDNNEMVRKAGHPSKDWSYLLFPDVYSSRERNEDGDGNRGVLENYSKTGTGSAENNPWKFKLEGMKIHIKLESWKIKLNNNQDTNETIDLPNGLNVTLWEKRESDSAQIAETCVLKDRPGSVCFPIFQGDEWVRQNREIFLKITESRVYLDYDNKRYLADSEYAESQQKENIIALPPEWSSREQIAKDESPGLIKTEGEDIGSPDKPVTFYYPGYYGGYRLQKGDKDKPEHTWEGIAQANGKGKYVTELQKDMKKLGYWISARENEHGMKISGEFDEFLAGAVVLFKIENGIKMKNGSDWTIEQTIPDVPSNQIDEHCLEQRDRIINYSDEESKVDYKTACKIKNAANDADYKRKTHTANNLENVEFGQLPPSENYTLLLLWDDLDYFENTKILAHFWGRENLVDFIKKISKGEWANKFLINDMSRYFGGVFPGHNGDHQMGIGVDINPYNFNELNYCDFKRANFKKDKAKELAEHLIANGSTRILFNCNYVVTENTKVFPLKGHHHHMHVDLEGTSSYGNNKQWLCCYEGGASFCSLGNGQDGCPYYYFRLTRVDVTYKGNEKKIFASIYNAQGQKIKCRANQFEAALKIEKEGLFHSWKPILSNKKQFINANADEAIFDIASIYEGKSEHDKKGKYRAEVTVEQKRGGVEAEVKKLASKEWTIK